MRVCLRMEALVYAQFLTKRTMRQVISRPRLYRGLIPALLVTN